MMSSRKVIGYSEKSTRLAHTRRDGGQADWCP